MKPFASTSPRGYSLTELLVALLIGATLLALLLGVYHRSAGAGASARCLTNLRQVTAALLGWTAEHRGSFPFCVEDNEQGVATRHYWAGRLYEGGYLSDHRFFFCPSQKDLYYQEPQRAARWSNPSAGEWAYIGYGINRTGIAPRKRWSTNQTASLPVMKDLASILLLAEANAPGQIRDGWYHFLGSDVLRDAGALIEGRHDGAAHVAFADGHLERRRVDDLRRSYPNPKLPPWVEGVYVR